MEKKCNIELFIKNIPYFEMLKDVQRQEILMNLSKYGSLNVSELVELSELSMPAVSHHLKLLSQSGIVESKKIGTKKYYKLSLEQVITDLEELLEGLRILNQNSKG